MLGAVWAPSSFQQDVAFKWNTELLNNVTLVHGLMNAKVADLFYFLTPKKKQVNHNSFCVPL